MTTTADTSPYTLESYYAFIRFVHRFLVVILNGMPIDEDGDVVPLDSEAVNTDLMILLAEVEDEIERIHPLVSYMQ